MPKIRVLVVDDSVVIRKILTDVLSADPDIEVVGTAANGRIALQKISQVNPDVVTLDIEMPELNGLDTIPLVRQTHPSLPIIMFSTLTERGGRATLEALSRGASDYVTKPANVGSVSNAREAVQRELVDKIKALADRAGRGGPRSNGPQVPPPRQVLSPTSPGIVPARSSVPVRILAIGVSTGGPNALATLIPSLPKDFSVPVMIVQHMPPMFTRLLAERLTAQSGLRVVEATSGVPVEAGTVYLAPGDYHLEATQSGGGVITRTHQGPQENSCRPAVDVLFRSVVSVYGAGTLGLILTGMGQDGLVGCRHIKEAGGHVIAQDRASSVVWGMPGYVVEAGLADAVLPLNDVGAEIIRRSRNSNVGAKGTH